MKNKISIVLIVLVVVGVGVGLAMKHTTAPQQAAAPNTQTAPSNQVTITNYAFSPASLTVKAGTTVTWTNQDAVAHTVTADSGAGPDSALLDKGQSYSFKFDTPGTYAYHCKPHPFMKATVTVQ